MSVRHKIFKMLNIIDKLNDIEYRYRKCCVQEVINKDFKYFKIDAINIYIHLEKYDPITKADIEKAFDSKCDNLLVFLPFTPGTFSISIIREVNRSWKTSFSIKIKPKQEFLDIFHLYARNSDKKMLNPIRKELILALKNFIDK